MILVILVRVFFFRQRSAALRSWCLCFRSFRSSSLGRDRAACQFRPPIFSPFTKFLVENCWAKFIMAFCHGFWCMAGTTEKRCRRLTGQRLFGMWKPCDGMGVPFTMSSGGSACCDVDLCLSSLEEKEWMLTADHLRIVYELNWLKVRGSVQARPSHFSRSFGKSSCRFCVFLELQHNQSWCFKQSAKLLLSAFMIICDLLRMFVPRLCFSLAP